MRNHRKSPAGVMDLPPCVPRYTYVPSLGRAFGRVRKTEPNRLLRRPFAVTPWAAIMPGNHGAAIFPLEPAAADEKKLTYRSVRWVLAATSSAPPAPMWHATSSNPTNDDLFNYQLPTLRRIPEGEHRKAFATLVRSAFGGYADTRDPAQIVALLRVVKLHLRQLIGNATKHQREAHLRNQLSGNVLLQDVSLLDAAVAHADDDDPAVRTAVRQVREGYAGRAATTLARPPAPARDFDALLKDLRNLHPDGESPAVGTPLTCPFAFTADDVQTAAKRACKGAAPGPSGWTDELLSDVISSNDDLARDVAALTSDIACGFAPAKPDPLVRRLLTRSKLIGIPKVPTGTRPIALGETFTKLAASLAMNARKMQLMKLFDDTQKGVFSSGGAEAIVHRARAHLRSHPDHVVVTMDVRNAFNAISRPHIAAALHQHDLEDFDGLFGFVYGTPSELLVPSPDPSKAAIIIESRCGTKQGGAEGGLFFCIGIHPILLHMRTLPGVASIAFYDDVTILAKDAPSASVAVDTFRSEAEAMGLHCNESKCEWIAGSTQPPPRASFAASFAQPAGPFKLLGATIAGTDEAETSHLRKRLAKKHDMFFNRLQRIRGAAASTLLAMCGVPKVNYLLRTHAPAVTSIIAEQFDDEVEAVWSSMAMVEPTGTNRILAHLPRSMGGLSFTRAVRLAAPAYTASLNAAFHRSPVDQRTLSAESNQVLANELDAVSPFWKRIREANASAGSADFLFTPAGAIRPTDHAAALRLRLASPAYGAPDSLPCPGCHDTFPGPQWVHHVTGCPRLHGESRNSRHARLKVAFRRLCNTVGVQVADAEPRFGDVTCPACGIEMPAAGYHDTHKQTCALRTPLQDMRVQASGPDMLIYLGDQQFVIDFTVVSTTSPSQCTQSVDSLYKAREAAKIKKYGARAKEAGAELVVAIASNAGSLAPRFKALVRRVIAGSETSLRTALSQLSSAVTCGTAAALVNAERQTGFTTTIANEVADARTLVRICHRQDALPDAVARPLLRDAHAAKFDLLADAQTDIRRLHDSIATLSTQKILAANATRMAPKIALLLDDEATKRIGIAVAARNHLCEVSARALTVFESARRRATIFEQASAHILAGHNIYGMQLRLAEVTTRQAIWAHMRSSAVQTLTNASIGTFCADITRLLSASAEHHFGATHRLQWWSLATAKTALRNTATQVPKLRAHLADEGVPPSDECIECCIFHSSRGAFPHDSCPEPVWVWFDGSRLILQDQTYPSLIFKLLLVNATLLEFFVVEASTPSAAPTRPLEHDNYADTARVPPPPSGLQRSSHQQPSRVTGPTDALSPTKSLGQLSRPHRHYNQAAAHPASGGEENDIPYLSPLARNEDDDEQPHVHLRGSATTRYHSATCAKPRSPSLPQTVATYYRGAGARRA
jgi:hypothetical protein